jgi:hypothetical protein
MKPYGMCTGGNGKPRKENKQRQVNYFSCWHKDFLYHQDSS